MKSTKTLLLNVVFKSLVVAMPIFTLFSSSVFADDEVKINENETLSQFTVEQLTVSPAKIELTHRFDYRQLLITGIVNGGQKVDLTRYAKITNGPQFVKLTENRRIEPFTNGTETLQFAVGDKTVDVQVRSQGYGRRRESQFHSRCATSAFKTWLQRRYLPWIERWQKRFQTCPCRGYDALYDWRALADDVGARRFNRVDPDQSLMLLKSSGEVPHVGGQVTKPGEPHYELLKQWIRQRRQKRYQ